MRGLGLQVPPGTLYADQSQTLVDQSISDNPQVFLALKLEARQTQPQVIEENGKCRGGSAPKLNRNLAQR